MLRGDVFVPQYQGPARRPPGPIGAQRLIFQLNNEGLSLEDICELLGERGINPADELDRFSRGHSYEFTVDEGCDRLEQALAEIAQWRKESASPARDSSPGSGAARSADASTARVSTELSVPSSGLSVQGPAVSSRIPSQQAYNRRSDGHEPNHSAGGPSRSSSSAARRE